MLQINHELIVKAAKRTKRNWSRSYIFMVGHVCFILAESVYDACVQGTDATFRLIDPVNDVYVASPI